MKGSRSFSFMLMLLLSAFFSPFVEAQVSLPSIFTDNMILQQQTNVAFWGWDQPGKTITITTSWNSKNYTTKTNDAGKWMLKAATPKAGNQAYTVTISDGKAIKLNNVLIGEVWLCTGQSNMEMPMKGFKGQPIIGSNEAILKSKNSQIRLYTVPRSSITEEQKNSKPSPWKLAEPESVSNFSATAYYFGKLLNEMLDVPIGLINDSYGGSTVEAWMSADNLKAFPEIKVPAKTDSIKEKSRTPTTLYNGMIHPVIGFTIKGEIWYQGESNYDRPDQYLNLFQAFVKQQRNLWGIGDFPFYYAQIAPFNYLRSSPQNIGEKYNSAYLRDAQRIASDQIPNTGMAVLLDIGEEKSIHPSHKVPGGERLAYLALAKTYGLTGFGFASPSYQSMSVKDNVATVRFKDAANGLTSFSKDLTQFEIAGADKVFHPAKAVINGSSIAVSAAEVKTPVAVRYAFKDFVVGELFGNDGLPVSSFRTDNW